MAKQALIQRELKRDKLVAKYAKVHADNKAISNDAKATEEQRAAAQECADDQRHDTAEARRDQHLDQGESFASG